MNKIPLISFIVPVFNTENTLAKCLDSILNQSESDHEIIIVNDGTKDQSQIIIDNYTSKYPTIIRSYKKENGGLSDARNYGIEKASGEFIAFVDSDDFIATSYIKDFKIAYSKADFDMLVIRYNRIYNKKASIFERYYKFSQWNNFDQVVNLKSNPEIIYELEVASWLRIIKRSLFTENPSMLFTKGRIYEDLEASLKWYLFAKKIYLIDKVNYNYIISNNTLNFNISNIDHYYDIIDSVCAFYKINNQFDIYYTELEYLFTKHLLFSNLVRLKASRTDKKYEKFMSLEKKLKCLFPNYHKNKIMKNKFPFINIIVCISHHIPIIIRLSLLGFKSKL
ncbi:MAG: glycosyltransferase family 2 protein [Bacteroidota bacterium]